MGGFAFVNARKQQFKSRQAGCRRGAKHALGLKDGNQLFGGHLFVADDLDMTPEQRAGWRRDVAAIEEEKPELTRWANDVQTRKRAMLQEVTELLQAARESSGMTLDQLQQATGIDAAQLSKLLKADGNPTLYTLQRVADALGKRLVFSLAEK